jgi:hypothetical protein
LLSASTLTGIRFYGIGNEWLGLLLGAAIVSLVPGWLGILVVCAVGLPYFGADAGGTLAATTAFAVLYLAKHKSGWKGWHVAAGFGLALVVTGAFAALDRLQPDAARSHVGAALATGETPTGLSRLTDLILRKIAMNGSLFLSPWTLLTIVVMVAIGFGLRRMTLPPSPALSRLRSTIIPAALSGAVVAFLFNDGGVAAGLLILVPLLVTYIDTLLSGNMGEERD